MKQILYKSLVLGAILLVCFLIQPGLLNKNYVATCTATTVRLDDYNRCFSSYWDIYYLLGIGSFVTLLVIPVLTGLIFLYSKLSPRNRMILLIILFVTLLLLSKFAYKEAKIFVAGFLFHNPS